MSPRQNGMYWGEWGKARAVLRKKGIDPKQCDAKRHQLHIKALGVDKSHDDFKNRDLDKVLAEFYAISKPDDLNAQLRQLDQAGDRMSGLEKACFDLALQMPKVAADKNPQAYAKNYLDSIARSHTGKVFEQLDEDELNRIRGILLDRVPRALRKTADLAASATPPAERITDPKDDPF